MNPDRKSALVGCQGLEGSGDAASGHRDPAEAVEMLKKMALLLCLSVPYIYGKLNCTFKWVGLRNERYVSIKLSKTSEWAQGCSCCHLKSQLSRDALWRGPVLMFFSVLPPGPQCWAPWIHSCTMTGPSREAEQAREFRLGGHGDTGGWAGTERTTKSGQDSESGEELLRFLEQTASLLLV
jgi:hypothetical protein